MSAEVCLTLGGLMPDQSVFTTLSTRCRWRITEWRVLVDNVSETWKGQEEAREFISTPVSTTCLHIRTIYLFPNITSCFRPQSAAFITLKSSVFLGAFRTVASICVYCHSLTSKYASFVGNLASTIALWTPGISITGSSAQFSFSCS